MTNFTSARLTLTSWYLLIIMVISSVFSGVIYKMLTYEVDRLVSLQQARMERQLQDPFSPVLYRQQMYIDPDLVDEAKHRLLMTLIVINGTILVLSGLLGYLLAGRTLQPIETALEEQQRFIADASHELRTPLTALKTEVEVALRDKKLDLPSAKKYLASNLEEIDKLKNLTNNLLSLSRVSHKSQTTLSTVQLNELVGQVIDRLVPLMDAKSLKLENHVASRTMRTSPEALSEVLSILLDNAIKYSPPGKTIHLSSSFHGKNLHLCIRDEGIGIKSSDLPHIFNRFYRADTSRTKTHIDGFGLGLSIAQKLIHSLGGRIEVSSVIDVGSTFIVIVPCKTSVKSQISSVS